jgi:ATP-dependent Clp protease ATP-binding subunit ClpA
VQTLRRLQSTRTIVIGIAGYYIAARICNPTSSCFTFLTSLTGPSGSGKSHFAKELVNFLPGSTIIGMDNYMQREKARLFTCFP